MSDIDVKHNADTDHPWITGMSLEPPHSLLLADHWNHCVKSLNTSTYRISHQLTLPSKPWDISCLPEHRAAVTLPGDRKIQLISTKSGLSKLRSIKVNGECFGISSTNDKLVVTFMTPVKLEVMDLNGKVQVILSSDKTGVALFKNPQYVAVSEECSKYAMYVSCVESKYIPKYSLDGQLLLTYTNATWRKGLKGLVATEDGKLLVCNFKEYRIDNVSSDGKSISTILNTSDELCPPQAICFSSWSNTIFVSSGNGNISLRAYILT